MHDIRNDIQAVWRHLAQRNHWALVATHDEAQFLDEAVAEFHLLSGDKSYRDRLRCAVQNAYSVRLYRGIWRRDNQAAAELWAALVRTAVKRQIPLPEAEDLAQETMLRVIAKLDSVRSPQRLIAWTFTIFRHCMYDRSDHDKTDPFPADEDETRPDLPDTVDIAEVASNRVLAAQLEQILAARLTSELQKLVIKRIVMLQDRPRDVARDLGVPLHRIRNIKSRALAKLRADPDFVQVIRDLASQEP